MIKITVQRASRFTARETRTLRPFTQAILDAFNEYLLNGARVVKVEPREIVLENEDKTSAFRVIFRGPLFEMTPFIRALAFFFQSEMMTHLYKPEDFELAQEQTDRALAKIGIPEVAIAVRVVRHQNVDLAFASILLGLGVEDDHSLSVAFGLKVKQGAAFVIDVALATYELKRKLPKYTFDLADIVCPTAIG